MNDEALSAQAAGRYEHAARGPAMEALLEAVPCDLCGASHSRTLFKAAETRSWWLDKCRDDPRLDASFEFPIVECAECRHVFVNPRLNRAVNSEIYARYWRNVEPKGIAHSDYASYVCRQLAAFTGVGELLDFGCGWGTQIAAAKRAGWRAVGVEVDERKVEFCREHGLDAILADLLDRPFPAERFDAVVAEQVFEHLYSPVAYMRELHRVLRPGGAAYVAVPNLGSIEARLTGRRWSMIHPVSHVRYFDYAGLVSLMSRCGFEVLRPAYAPRFAGAPLKNALHGVKTFIERSFRFYPLGLGLIGRKT